MQIGDTVRYQWGEDFADGEVVWLHGPEDDNLVSVRRTGEAGMSQDRWAIGDLRVIEPRGLTLIATATG